MSEPGSKITDRAADELWRKIVLPVNSTIQQAIHNLNQFGVRIVLVVNENGKFEGTISDGDIRRGLLKGLNLESWIDKVIHRESIIVPPGMDRGLVTRLMTANKIQQIPVVDENHYIVGIHLWDQISTPEKRQNLMVIMAGGLGNRLSPLTKNCPKPLLNVAGKPILEHIIERAKLEGFSRFVLAIHYLGEMIECHFGNGEKYDVQIDYLRESFPMGTAGALGLLVPVPDAPFIVTNGDVISDIHYTELLDFHVHHKAAATMAVRVHEWQHPFGVVQTKGIEIIGFEEKPIARSHINAGVYVLEPSVLSELASDEPCDMPSLFERLQTQAKRTVAYPMHEPWLDVGHPDDFAKANGKSNEVGR